MNTSVDLTSNVVAGISVPTIAPPAEEARRIVLDERLEAVLRGTCTAYGAIAAEFWLLDDTTKQLNHRTSWEKSQSSPVSTKPRPLAAADADVAAMAGGIVTLEHPADLLQWHCHRTASSAVCLPISSDKTIHGSLWLFFDRQKQFANRELEMLEIVAGRLAIEIERDVLLHGPAQKSSTTHRAPEIVFENHSEATSELEISNWTNQSSEENESLWSILPNGHRFAFSSSVISSPEVTHEQAALAIEKTNALAYELGGQFTDAGELLTEMNQRLIKASSNQTGLAIAIAILDSEGAGTIATAGPSSVLQVRAATLRSHVGENTPLGWDSDAIFKSMKIDLKVRERLVMLTGTPQLSNPILQREIDNTFRAPTADAHRAMNAKECVERLLRVKSEELGAITAIRRI